MSAEPEPLTHAERLLAQVATVPDALDVIAVAEAARVLAERMRLGTNAVNHATVIKLRAERRLADLVDAGQDNGTIATRRDNQHVRTPDKLSSPVSKQRLAEARKIRDAYTDQDLLNLAEQNHGKEIRRHTLLRAARRQAAETRRATPTTGPPADPRLLVGDFREVLTSIEPGTVDAIITDPPYPKEYLPLYGDLSELAAKLLKPDGLLVVMVGQYHLPDYMAGLGSHLRYHWTGCYLAAGDHARIFPARVRAGWKPLLIYRRPDAATSPWFMDVFRSQAVRGEKQDHPWQQSEDGMADIIGRLTDHGALIVDPFLGAGTTAVAAVRLGRRVVGCHLDPEAIATASRRLTGAVPG